MKRRTVTLTALDYEFRGWHVACYREMGEDVYREYVAMLLLQAVEENIWWLGGWKDKRHLKQMEQAREALQLLARQVTGKPIEVRYAEVIHAQLPSGD